jgi:hypothetical protein
VLWKWCTAQIWTDTTVYFRVHRNSILIPSLDNTNPFCTLLIYLNVLFSFCHHLFLGLASGCFFWGFPTKPSMYFPRLPHILTYVTTQHMFTAGFHPENDRLMAETSWYLLVVSFNSCGPGSSVSIATDYGLGGPGIESRWGRDFPHLSRPALGPTQPPVQ